MTILPIDHRPMVHHQAGDPIPESDRVTPGIINAPMIDQEEEIERNIRTESLVSERAGGILHQIRAELMAIKLMLAKEMEQPEEDTTTTLTNVEIRLQRNGRRFVLIFTPVGIMNVLFNTLGIAFTYTLLPGWNIINLPDGTFMSGPPGTKQVIIIRQTNWYNGSAI